MGYVSVRYRKQIEAGGGDRTPVPVEQAIERVKQLAAIRCDRGYKNGKKRKAVDQTVVVVMHLGIDPKQAEQMLRGAISLPKGTGKTQRVIAFCDDADMAKAAKEAGAVEAGGDELIEKINGGWSEFDVAVAHPRMMGKVGKLGRVLGPQGKMPSPKAGTVTPDVVTAAREYSGGKVEFRNDAGGNIHLPVGRMSFSTADLRENIDAVVSHIVKIRPPSAKGHYVRRVCISGSSTPSVQLAIG